MLQWLFPKTYERMMTQGDGSSRRASMVTDKQRKQSLGRLRLRLAPIKMAESNGNQPFRQQVEDGISQISGVIHAALRPLPEQTGDGTYLPDTNTETGIWSDLTHIGIRDVETLIDVVRGGASSALVDDKDLLMERIIQLAAALPINSKNGVGLTNAFLNQLWCDLKHPPLSYLGDKYSYRQADGSGNNILWPQIGASGTPYARSVRAETLQPIALPDPGTIFDSIMVRGEFKPHPNKISSILFYLASIIIHDLFRTDYYNPAVSMTSSYLDLSPLYGSNQGEQDAMRTFKDGKIKPDCFSEKRLLGFPPGVGVIVILFNRFHNYVVEQLASINERGRFTKPKEGTDESTKRAYATYDNDLFQTGRLITCGLYINCILKDYVRTILGLNRTNSVWDLDPRTQEGKSVFGQGAAEAGGNQVSAEFNLVYRWHSCVSQRDEKWTNEIYEKLFPGKDPASIDLRTFTQTLAQFEGSLPDDPPERPFANLSRKQDGTYNDDDIAKILTESIEDVAGAYGARQVPLALRAVEILGIHQARSWNLGSLNEFRKFFGLAPHKTFEDINSNPEIAEQLKNLYDHPDFVELYPGMAMEDAKPPMSPGSGLCTTYTISRAVLSDAVALVRGDRFYTVDYTPKNLTNWGYSEVNYDLTVDQGCVFYKLILRALPNNFKPNSVYVHFPMVVPSENRKILESLGTADKYNWDRPAPIAPLTFITSYAAGKAILENKIDYKVTWGDTISFLMYTNGKDYGRNFCLSGDDPVNLDSRQKMQTALYRDHWEREVKAFYEDITLKLLHQNAYKIAGVNQVDIVRDVGNIANVHFCANIFSFPLKTEDNPLGIYTEQELYLVMAVVFTAIFFDADPAKSFPLRQAARKVAQQLGQLTLLNVEAVGRTGLFATLIDRLHKHSALTDYGIHMIQRCIESGLDARTIVFQQILPTAGGMVANQAQLFAQCLDYYLSPEGVEHLPEINRLAKMDTPEADEVLLHYFMEGSRMKASVGLYREVAKSATIDDDGKKVSVEPGHRLMVDLVTASMDQKTFPNPDKVVLDRDLNTYIHYGIGPHQCLGYGMSKIGLAAMLKTVGRLDNLRRAPGPQGQSKQFTLPGGFSMYMMADQSSYFPFPTSMKVQWDGDLQPMKK